FDLGVPIRPLKVEHPLTAAPARAEPSNATEVRLAALPTGGSLGLGRSNCNDEGVGSGVGVRPWCVYIAPNVDHPSGSAPAAGGQQAMGDRSPPERSGAPCRRPDRPRAARTAATKGWAPGGGVRPLVELLHERSNTHRGSAATNPRCSTF